MLAPLVVVCLVAFTPGNTLTIPSTEFSLRWFAAVFKHSDFVTAFWNSLWLAIAAASLSTAIAIPAGLAITRFQFTGRDALNGLFLSPLIVPHLVLGVALLRLFSLIGATGSFGWLILAHTLIVTPYVLRLIVAASSGMDRHCEDAALSLGASRATVFWRVTLPIFVTSPVTVTLPVRMYMYATESVDPLMAAVSALMVALTAGVMLILDRLYGLDKILVGEK